MMHKKTICRELYLWRKPFLLLLLAFTMTAVYAQNLTVTGKVIDDLNEPIIGANVLERGTTNGVITDLDGNYSLTVSANATLQFSYVGYNTIEIPARGQNQINVTLSKF